jgi:signal peptidase I
VNIILIAFLIARVGVTIGYWKLFEKAGLAGWKSLIPFYSEYVICVDIVGKPKWWILYVLLPVIGTFAWIILLFNMLRCFGKDSLGSQVLLVIAGFIYLPYLGFSKEVKYLGKLDQLPEQKKTVVQEWTDAIVFAVVAATLIRWLIMEAYTIPTPSMENSLLVGDFLFVSKFHYGTRTTSTPLQVPLTHQKIWLTDIPSYSTAIQLPQYRLPGISHVKREDVVVFNVPPKSLNENIEYPVDLKTNYIKRCVGIPGDILEIKNQIVYANGTALGLPPEMQFSYEARTTGQINPRNLERLGLGVDDIGSVSVQPDGRYIYTFYLTKEKFDKLNAEKPSYIESISLIMNQPPDAQGIFPYCYYTNTLNPKKKYVNWSRDNFGPLWVPKEGATIPVNDSTMSIYGFTILDYEHHENAKIENGKLIIDGKELTEYTFKQDYYFMMGDNRHNSLDSRYWGFVPADHIVGKAFFIWLSIDKEGSFLNKIRWSRFFNLID